MLGEVRREWNKFSPRKITMRESASKKEKRRKKKKEEKRKKKKEKRKKKKKKKRKSKRKKKKEITYHKTVREHNHPFSMNWLFRCAHSFGY